MVVLRKRGGLNCNGRHDDNNNTNSSSDIHFQALCETLTHTSFTSGISCSRLICHRLPLQSPGTLTAEQQCPPVDHSVLTPWVASNTKPKKNFKVPISKKFPAAIKHFTGNLPWDCFFFIHNLSIKKFQIQLCVFKEALLPFFLIFFFPYWQVIQK